MNAPRATAEVSLTVGPSRSRSRSGTTYIAGLFPIRNSELASNSLSKMMIRWASCAPRLWAPSIWACKDAVACLSERRLRRASGLDNRTPSLPFWTTARHL
ncbi:MAG: hypothetical protein HN797_11110 [Tateyamaria sp.]|nr:hypothetical protein [Tateyamaria sp.]